MKFGVWIFLSSSLIILCGILGLPNCGTLPTEELRVGRIKGVLLGSSGDLHDGFNYDLAQFIGQKLHKKVVFKELAGSHLIQALREDEVDILCASLNITNERKQEVAMVHVFGQPYPFISLLFWDSSHQKELAKAKHIRDVVNFFKTRSIGVAVQSALWPKLLKKYGINNIKYYEKETLLVSGLRNGEVSAILLGRISSDFLENQYSTLWALRLALDKPYGYGIGVAINKERPELAKQIANAIQDLKDEGMINMWQQKWFGKIY